MRRRQNTWSSEPAPCFGRGSSAGAAVAVAVLGASQAEPAVLEATLVLLISVLYFRRALIWPLELARVETGHLEND